MKFYSLLLLFLIINFGGLYVGNILMNNGPQTDWYINLNKAPWTPPGWVFGATWTLIMICFSIWCAYAFKQLKSNTLTLVFIIGFILNVSWNYVFFNQHKMLLGLIVIIALTIIVFSFLFSFTLKPKALQALILPYAIWLCIATSLNLYAVLYN